MFGTICMYAGVFGLLLILAGWLYLKKYSTPANCVDPIAIIIGLFYKYVIIITAILIIIAALIKLI